MLLCPIIVYASIDHLLVWEPYERLIEFCVNAHNPRCEKEYNRDMIRHGIVALSGTAVEITTPDTNTSFGVDVPNTVSVQNLHSTGNAYLGSSSVTTTDYGFKLEAGQIFAIDLGANDRLYAVGDSGVTVAVLTLDGNNA